MSNIDLRTMGFVLFIMHIVQLFIFTHLYVSNKSMREIKWWIYWCAAGTGSFFLIAIRQGVGASELLVVVQNAVMVFGAVLLYIGVLRFYGQRENIKMVGSCLALYIGSLVYFTYVHESVRIHTTVTNIMLSILGVLTAAVLIKFRPSEKSNSLTVIYSAFLFHGLVFALKSCFCGCRFNGQTRFFLA
jgi:hypothetical protein